AAGSQSRLANPFVPPPILVAGGRRHNVTTRKDVDARQRRRLNHTDGRCVSPQEVEVLDLSVASHLWASRVSELLDQVQRSVGVEIDDHEPRRLQKDPNIGLGPASPPLHNVCCCRAKLEIPTEEWG